MAGTMRRRITEASMRMLAPRPRASILITTLDESRNEKNTLVMISAAQLMTQRLTRAQAKAQTRERLLDAAVALLARGQGRRMIVGQNTPPRGCFGPR